MTAAATAPLDSALKNLTQGYLSQMGIDRSLNAFPSHGLDDLSNAKLMDRVETKFVLPIRDLAGILAGLADQYSVLEIGGNRVFNYENTYLDTPDFKLYSMHHNGQLNRHKVRHRFYKETGTGFLEIKFKNNKRRTDKTRIRMDSFNSNNLDEAQVFLQQKLKSKYQDLAPQQSSSYKRIALANEAESERITIDFDLCFGRYEEEQSSTITDHFIVEVKQQNKNNNSPFLRLMKSRAIRPSSFSKYCFGCCSIGGAEIKQNRFKPIMQKLTA